MTDEYTPSPGDETPQQANTEESVEPTVEMASAPETAASDDGAPAPLSSDSRGWAVAAHLLPLLGLSLLGPLFVWLIKRDEDEFVAGHAVAALNFHLSMLIWFVISFILIIIFIGIFMLLGLGILSLVVAIIAAVKASNGEEYTYPLTINFIKG